MSKKYVKAYFDWVEQTSALSDAEKGRLFIAILEYARSGREPEDSGREGLVFPTFKATIDRENEISAIRSENGAKGGRPVKANESKIKQTKANESKQKPTNNIRHKTQDEDIRQKTKTKTEEENINTNMSVSTEPQSASVLALPLTDGTEFEISEADVEQWSGLYPAVDVLQALRSMLGWLDVNPTKRKTRAGIRRFINTWLAKEQDRGGTKGYTGYKKPEEKATEEKRRKAHLSDLVEYPPNSGEYRPYWEVPTA